MARRPGRKRHGCRDPPHPGSEFALADAARRAQVDRSALKMVSAEAVVWPDGSLGCAQPGVFYTQAPVPGYWVRIEAGGRTLGYHQGRGGAPFLCPTEQGTTPASLGKV